MARLRRRYLRTWRESPPSARGPGQLLIKALIRPGSAARDAWRAARTDGRAAEALGGVSPARQALQMYRLRLAYGIEPNVYYWSRAYEPGRAVVGRYAVRSLMSLRLGRLIIKAVRAAHGHASINLFYDKREFPEWAARHSLPAVPILGVWAAGRRVDDGAHEWPHTDLFSKPTDGSGGKGVRRWRYDDGSWRDSSGTRYSAADIDAALTAQLAEGPYAPKADGVLDRAVILQPALDNHPAMRGLTPGGLATVRIVTLWWLDGRTEALAAALRMPVGDAIADNFHLGGLGAPVDLETGRLGPAVTKALAPHARQTHHPTTGRPIEGEVLPDWQAALALAHRAHEAFPVRMPVVGWDVALTGGGPVLIEANGIPGTDLMEYPSGVPLGATQWAVCVDAYLSAVDAGGTP
jgi:hypothetical protein